MKGQREARTGAKARPIDALFITIGIAVLNPAPLLRAKRAVTATRKGRSRIAIRPSLTSSLTSARLLWTILSVTVVRCPTAALNVLIKRNSSLVK